ncbi:DNA polymerase Y family protein [Homoserinibacter sp. GY 40078]|uniref:DNA polymerase Y family protein n=1 Tax=Homoserinibacter sp. GY 40078 TaxID=2603275 RepID=UPI0011C80E11|nr:DNA polymerase Y family protein [Homoserinibacter sp. GY 40078]TXK17626.1 DNA polymerase Y family protein [Homoserinibacter sp. GY 40078]
MTGSAPRLLVLHAPDWGVRAQSRLLGIRDEASVVLIARGRVVACSPAARAEGVRSGMRQREAQGRCPGLHVLREDPGSWVRAFEPVLAALDDALPGWHLLRPGTAAIRVRGPARYYGSEKAAARTVVALAEQHGAADARVGIAAGLFAAELAARAPDPDRVRIVTGGSTAAFLAPLPVGVLGDDELGSLLPRLGIRTLGAFAALDPDDVAARFGPGGARLHLLARGRDPRPATPRIPPKDIDAVIDFEPAAERVDEVAFGVRAACGEFVRELLAARLVCTAVRVELHGDRGEVDERVWLHPRSFGPSEVVDRVRWQLQAAEELRSGVVRVRVSPEAVDPVHVHEAGLWGTGPEERVHSALSRVQAMLGHRGVLTPQLSGGRRPADRQQLVPWGDRPVSVRERTQPWPGALPDPPPSTVYEVPRPVRVEDAAGQPVTIGDRGLVSAAPSIIVSQTGTRRDLTAWAGPWPLDERWWDPASARSAHRLQAVDTTGCAWLLVLDDAGWWAEGRYD